MSEPTDRIPAGPRPQPQLDPAEERARSIWRDVQLGIPQPRPEWWPDIDAVSAAGEQVAVNTHCSACRSAA